MASQTLDPLPAVLNLAAPYRAILRCYRCDTPYRAMLFEGGEQFHKTVRSRPLLYGFTHAAESCMFVRYPILQRIAR